MASNSSHPPPSNSQMRDSIAVLMQKQKEAQEMLTKHLKEDLTDQDRAALKKAGRKFMTHATVGLWLGGAVGAAFAFRGRLKRMPGASYYPGRVKDVVKSDAVEGAAKAGKGSPGVDPTTERFRFIAKGLGFGMVGSLIGTQIGMVTGASAAQKVIDTEGSGAMEKVKWAVDKVAAELTALEDIEKSGQRGPQRGQPSVDSDAPQSEGFYRNETVDDQSNDDSSAKNIGSSPPVTSRWDELRKKSATPPSSWDVIRETHARENLPKSQNGSRNSPPGQEEPYVETDRDAQRREFEKLMEKERGGGDDEARDSRWKGNN